MSAFESRAKKLESRRFSTAERASRAMSDEQLEAFLQSALAGLSDAGFEQACREPRKLRPIYEECRNAP